ncbi:MAG: mitochondrial fission ELM1 family protein [Alphaproteobacteria bacterium]|nr:mitochondrial fission ELM1 family protein [Alphaproteobacteria bacterium]
MRVIGIESKMTGTNNQMRGVIVAGAKLRKRGEKVPVSREALLKAPDGTLLHPKNFASLTDFATAVQASVDAYLKENKAPEFVVLPFDQAKKKEENKDVDLLSLAVKKAFKARGHQVKTMVLLSNLYDYQNVDLINVGKHQLSDLDEAVLKSNPKLKSKVVETLGAAGNNNLATIRNHVYQLQSKYETFENHLKEKYGKIKRVLSGNLLYAKGAIIDHSRDKKNVLFSLGGITDNGAIGFDLKDAENLMKAAIKLRSKDYNVIFTNSPRTPSDVTDYLFERCKLYHMEFFNSKKIAQNDEEAQDFRNYSGKYKAEFEEQAKSIGNIYPAVLDVCEFVVNTHDSFSYTSDAAALGIPSVVYTGNYIDKERRPDCYKLFDLCHEKGYAISLDEAIAQIERGMEPKTQKMDGVSFQLVKAMAKSLSCERQNANTATR